MSHSVDTKKLKEALIAWRQRRNEKQKAHDAEEAALSQVGHVLGLPVSVEENGQISAAISPEQFIAIVECIPALECELDDAKRALRKAAGVMSIDSPQLR